MSEITSRAEMAANLLMEDCQLASFRKDEAARIVQDAMDWKEIETIARFTKPMPEMRKAAEELAAALKDAAPKEGGDASAD